MVSPATAPPAGEVTDLLDSWNQGDLKARDTLAEILSDDVTRIARHILRREAAHHTLETGALVNEAFMDLLRREKVQLKNRRHFLRVFASLMRRKLVDHARRKKASKRGDGLAQVPYQDDQGTELWTEDSLLLLDDALRDLSRHYPEGSQVVEMRFFCGMKGREIAEVLGVHPLTVHNRWKSAKLWLYRYLNEKGSGSFARLKLVRPKSRGKR